VEVFFCNLVIPLPAPGSGRHRPLSNPGETLPPPGLSNSRLQKNARGSLLPVGQIQWPGGSSSAIFGFVGKAQEGYQPELDSLRIANTGPAVLPYIRCGQRGRPPWRSGQPERAAFLRRASLAKPSPVMPSMAGSLVCRRFRQGKALIRVIPGFLGKAVFPNNLFFFKIPWIPAFAGMTALFLHYDTVSRGGG